MTVYEWSSERYRLEVEWLRVQKDVAGILRLAAERNKKPVSETDKGGKA